MTARGAGANAMVGAGRTKREIQGSRRIWRRMVDWKRKTITRRGRNRRGVDWKGRRDSGR